LSDSGPKKPNMIGIASNRSWEYASGLDKQESF